MHRTRVTEMQMFCKGPSGPKNRPFYSCCLVTWPMNTSEAGVDLVLIQTSLLFLFK